MLLHIISSKQKIIQKNLHSDIIKEYRWFNTTILQNVTVADSPKRNYQIMYNVIARGRTTRGQEWVVEWERVMTV